MCQAGLLPRITIPWYDRLVFAYNNVIDSLYNLKTNFITCKQCITMYTLYNNDNYKVTALPCTTIII